MKGWAPCVFPSKMVGSWRAPCVFPGKLVGSWWVPCVFPSKMVGSWWAPGGFLVFFQVKWWASGGLLVFFQVKWWAPGKLLAFFQVKWWHSGGLLVFFQVKWWAPGGLLVFFQVKWDPRGWSSNGFFVGTFGCHIAIFLDNPDGPKSSPTCHVQKFWRKAGPQQYLFFVESLRKTGGRWKATNTEKSHHSATPSPKKASENGPLYGFLNMRPQSASHAHPSSSLVWLGRWNGLACGPKNGPVRGGHFWTW